MEKKRFLKGLLFGTALMLGGLFFMERPVSAAVVPLEEKVWTTVSGQEAGQFELEVPGDGLVRVELPNPTTYGNQNITAVSIMQKGRKDIFNVGLDIPDCNETRGVTCFTLKKGKYDLTTLCGSKNYKVRYTFQPIVHKEGRTMRTAVNLKRGTTATALKTVELFGSDVWYKIKLKKPQKLSLTYSGYQSGVCTRFVLRLINAKGKVFNAGRVFQKAKKMKAGVLPKGVYYVLISPLNGIGIESGCFRVQWK